MNLGTTLYPEVLKQDCLLIAQLLKCLDIKTIYITTI